MVESILYILVLLVWSSSERVVLAAKVTNITHRNWFSGLRALPDRILNCSILLLFLELGLRKGN